MKKNSFAFLVAIFTVLVMTACHNDQLEDKLQEEPIEQIAENTAQVDMKVEGMVCAMGCAKFIQDAVSEVDGVVLSEVSFTEEKAHFEFDRSMLTAEEIKEIINNIHDGQYAATILAAEDNEPEAIEKSSNNENEEEDELSSVRQQHINITFPELFTYFLRSLRN